MQHMSRQSPAQHLTFHHFACSRQLFQRLLMRNNETQLPHDCVPLAACMTCLQLPAGGTISLGTSYCLR